MRIHHGNLVYSFDEVPVAHDGKPAWAAGLVWITYKHEEGRDDGRNWVETDYKFAGFSALFICDENGDEVEPTDRMKREIEEYLDVVQHDNILESIDYDRNHFA